MSFTYHIKRSARATRVRIVVKLGQVAVVAPQKGVSDQRIAQFVQEKHAWIVRALAKTAPIEKCYVSPIPTVFSEGTDILYRGKTSPLSIQNSPLKRLKIEFTDRFIIYKPDNLLLDQHTDVLQKRLIQWFKKQTLVFVQKIVDQHADKYKLFPRSITIKSQKSRWGSCAYQGDIYINWLLILAPPDILEYVVVHELCHLHIKNHSQQFWDLVTEHLPDYKQRRHWLKIQGRSLMAFHG